MSEQRAAEDARRKAEEVSKLIRLNILQHGALVNYAKLISIT